MSRRSLLVVLAVAAGLTICDQLFHVRTGTIDYHWQPQVLGQTVVVPVTFAVAALVMLRAADLSSARGRSRVAASSAVALTAYLVSGLLAPRLAVTYAVLLVVLWSVRVVLRGDRALVVLGIATAAGGVLGEAALSAAGEFSYARPDVLGVPWWLFGLYLHGSLLAVDLAQRLRVSPPSTGTMTPVRKPAAGDSTNAATLPNSSGAP